MLATMSQPAVRFRLAHILKERKMTQKELADRSGVSRQAISKLAGTPRQVRLDTLEAICKTLDIEPGDLFELENED